MTKTVRVAIHSKDGQVLYTEAPDEIAKILVNLPLKINWRKEAAPAVLRNKYFQMLDEARKATATGYTKNELHNVYKRMILPKFEEFPHYFNNAVFENTTAALNHEGWVAYIEEFKVHVHDTLGYTLT